MQKIVPNILSVLVLLTMLACTSSKGDGQNQDSPRPLFHGDLDKKLVEIYGEDNEINFDDCDFKNRERILEVARTLEQKRSEIETLTKSLTTSDSANYQEFGTFKLRNDLNKNNTDNRWVQEIFSWTDAISLYDLIKQTPVNKKWLFLNQFVRGLVPNDENRIVYLRFGGGSRTAGPTFEAIRDIVRACNESPDCTLPALSQGQRDFLETNKAFRYYLGVLDNDKKTFNNKREVLERLLTRLQYEYARYEFKKNPTARVEGNSLVIPMDLSILGPEGGVKFVNFLESKWNVDAEKKIRIEATNRPVPSFLLRVDEIIGGRAFVRYADGGIMQLYNYGRLRTALHEFGHVIGLTDKYYTTWNAAACSYQDEFNSADLMSDSSGGSVLPEHWQKIKEIYWIGF